MKAQGAAQTDKGQKALALLRSIVADMRAMHFSPRPEEFHDTDMDMGAFFGPFNDYFDDAPEPGSDPEDGGFMCSNPAGIRVYWPNLKILMDEASELLDGNGK